MGDRILLKLEGQYRNDSERWVPERAFAFNYALNEGTWGVLAKRLAEFPLARIVRVRTVSRAERDRNAYNDGWRDAIESAAKAATAHAAVQATLSGATVCSAAESILRLLK